MYHSSAFWLPLVLIKTQVYICRSFFLCARQKPLDFILRGMGSHERFLRSRVTQSDLPFRKHIRHCVGSGSDGTAAP